MENTEWSKTIMTVYKYLKRMTLAFDRLIDSKATNSFYTSTNNYAFNNVFYITNSMLELIDRNVAPPKDAKSKLQEVAHVKGYGVPQYKIVGREGSEHEPIFEVEVSLGVGKSITAKGKNKKLAEMAAAEAMLEKISWVKNYPQDVDLWP